MHGEGKVVHRKKRVGKRVAFRGIFGVAYGRGVDNNHTFADRRVPFACMENPFAVRDKENFGEGVHMLVRFPVLAIFRAIVHTKIVFFKVIKLIRGDGKLFHVLIIARARGNGKQFLEKNSKIIENYSKKPLAIRREYIV